MSERLQGTTESREIARQYGLPILAVGVSAVASVVSGISAFEFANSETEGREALVVTLGVFSAGFASFAIGLGSRIPGFIANYRERNQSEELAQSSQPEDSVL